MKNTFILLFSIVLFLGVKAQNNISTPMNDMVPIETQNFYEYIENL